MSQEDLSSEFQSDESDNESKKLWSDGENDDGKEVNYWDLVRLHDNLVNFENIHFNNAIIDIEHYLESEGSPNFENDLQSLLALMEDYVNTVEDVLSSSSSSPSSVVPPEAVPSLDTEDSENTAMRLLQDLEGFVWAFQDMLTSFSSSSSDSSASDVQETNGDDTNNSE